MTRGRFYGVSVGPGDPELLTLKAVRVLREADATAAPNVGGCQTALGIISDHIGNKSVLDCSIPMSRDRTAALEAYRENAERICRVLDEGKSVAFVTIGDVTVYSTFFYLQGLVAAHGYETEVVPGVTSFCASAARLQIPLCEGQESLHVVPVGEGAEDSALGLSGTKVFMKAGKTLSAFRQTLSDAGLLERASLVVNCGYEDEQVFESFADAPDCLDDYFAVIIVKS